MKGIAQSIASAAGALLFLAALLGGLYLLGREHGGDARDASHRATVEEIDRAASEQRAEHARRLVRLSDDLAELRARPERVRAVARKERANVVADAECAGLPPSVRRLWNAAPDSESAGRTASPAGVDAEPVPGLAVDGR